ncbi:hypothetical protein [Paraburkholderia bonniea]|uniref:hypothetical protein n=1 Tax=Paraburkholderia bonniea TaxID=2152891 RepID=UPI001C2C5F14|nr:hypothetical protein [Paraburkholderia bonniea]
MQIFVSGADTDPGKIADIRCIFNFDNSHYVVLQESLSHVAKPAAARSERAAAGRRNLAVPPVHG